MDGLVESEPTAVPRVSSLTKLLPEEEEDEELNPPNEDDDDEDENGEKRVSNVGSLEEEEEVTLSPHSKHEDEEKHSRKSSGTKHERKVSDKQHERDLQPTESAMDLRRALSTFGNQKQNLKLILDEFTREKTDRLCIADMESKYEFNQDLMKTFELFEKDEDGCIHFQNVRALEELEDEEEDDEEEEEDDEEEDEEDDEEDEEDTSNITEGIMKDEEEEGDEDESGGEKRTSVDEDAHDMGIDEKRRLSMAQPVINTSVDVEIDKRVVQAMSKVTIRLTAKQQREIADAFNAFDVQGTGYMSAVDLRVALRALGYDARKQDIYMILEHYDKGNTGRLCYSDFMSVIEEKIAEQDTTEELVKAFKLFDKDQTGYITFRTLRQVVDELGEDANDEEIAELIAEADQDDDGTLDLPEFLKLLRKNSLY